MGILNNISNKLAIVATALGVTSAAAEEVPLHTQINVDNPQIATCIEEAIDAVEIPGAEKYFYAPNNNASNTLLMNADTGETNSDGATHSMGVNATLSDAIGPDYRVSLTAHHQGSLDENVIDSVNAAITLDFNTDSGIITNRFSGLNVEGRNTDGSRQKHTDTTHGQWVVDGVQTLEATFGNCMGMPFSDARPASGATSVVLAPPFIPKGPTQ